MILVNLFLGFLKVGCFSYGGAYGAIPLIRDVVLSYGWLDDDAITYMIAVSESTPGPIMINLATYVGSSQAGFLGAVLATLAVVLPSFAVVLLITALLNTVLKHPGVQAVLRGIKPCVIGVVLATGIYMMGANLLASGNGLGVAWRNALVTVLLAGAMLGYRKIKNKKMSPIVLILLSAVLGILIYR